MSRLFTSVETTKAHESYSHFSIMNTCDTQAKQMETMGRNVPAVDAKVKFGAAHLAANTRGFVEGA